MNDLEGKTVVELKAMAYDQLGIVEQCKINLQAINVEIQKNSTKNQPKEVEECTEDTAAQS